jgi:hypothetical protein
LLVHLSLLLFVGLFILNYIIPHSTQLVKCFFTLDKRFLEQALSIT